MVQICFNSAELMEDQLLLLLESLEEKIVPQQLKLVREHTSHLAQNEGGREVLFYIKQRLDDSSSITTPVSQLKVTLGRRERIIASNLSGIKILTLRKIPPRDEDLRFLTTVLLITNIKLDTADYHFS